MATDRLTLARAFRATGMEQDQADGVATAIFDAIHDNVATKADLATLQVTTKADLHEAIAELKYALTMRGIAGLIAAGGILFAALHYWPPGH